MGKAVAKLRPILVHMPTQKANDCNIRSMHVHTIACRVGSVRADFRVVTKESYTSKEVEDHVVALANAGSLHGLVDPATVEVNGG